MNYVQLVELAIASSSYQNVVTTLQDVALLGKVVDAAKKSGKFNPATLAKDGSLLPVAQAAERSIVLANKLLADKVQGAIVVALLESL